MLKTSFLVAGITLLSSVAAVAGTITTPTVSLTLTESNGLTSSNVNLQQFNPALGTLTGVTVNFGSTAIGANISMSDFEQGGSINITYNLGYLVSFTLPVGSPYVPEDFQALNCSGSGVEFATCGSSEAISFVYGATSFDLSAAPQGPFLGTGTVAFPYIPALVENLVGTPVPLNPTNLNLTVNALSLTTALSLTYTYTPVGGGVPEPTSLGLMGAGLSSLIWIARKRALAAFRESGK